MQKEPIICIWIWNFLKYQVIKDFKAGDMPCIIVCCWNANKSFSIKGARILSSLSRHNESKIKKILFSILQMTKVTRILLFSSPLKF